MLSALALLGFGLAISAALGLIGLYSLRAQREDAAKRAGADADDVAAALADARAALERASSALEAGRFGRPPV